MKSLKTLTVLFALFFSLTAHAQESQLLLVQEHLKPLQWITGNWKGSGWMMTQKGERMPFEQQEYVSYRLKNSILQIEGIGISNADTIHHALATLSYDVPSTRYQFCSYTSQGGNQTQASVEVKPNTFIWKMNTARGIIRYTIVLNEKGQWFEEGEFSADGEKSWRKFFEMTLDRVSNKATLTKQ